MFFLIMGIVLVLVGAIWISITVAGYKERNEEIIRAPKTWKYFSAPKGLICSMWFIIVGSLLILNWFTD